MRFYFSKMRTMLAFALIIFAGPNSHAQENPTVSRKAAESTEQIDTGVTKFFDDWKNGRATESESKFFDSEVPVILMRFDPNRNQHIKVFQRSARDTMHHWTETPPKHLVLDAVETKRLTEALAISHASYTGAGIKGEAAFTFLRKNEGWTIVSLVLKTRFNW